MTFSEHDINPSYTIAQSQPAEYKRGLNEFITLSTEKQKIAEFVLSQGDLGDLLDIGAGNGEVAKRIIDHSESYTAIEQNPNLCRQLGQLGIKVLQTTFPDRNRPHMEFDTILSSYSIPTQPERYPSFIEAMVETTAEQGKVIIVTNTDTPTDLTRLLNEVGQSRNIDGKWSEDLRSFLKTRGDVVETQIESEITAHSLDDVISAIAFIGSNNGNPAKHTLISSALHSNPKLLQSYITEQGYAFPLVANAFTLRPFEQQ